MKAQKENDNDDDDVVDSISSISSTELGRGRVMEKAPLFSGEEFFVVAEGGIFFSTSPLDSV